MRCESLFWGSRGLCPETFTCTFSWSLLCTAPWSSCKRQFWNLFLGHRGGDPWLTASRQTCHANLINSFFFLFRHLLPENKNPLRSTDIHNSLQYSVWFWRDKGPKSGFKSSIIWVVSIQSQFQFIKLLSETVDHQKWVKILWVIYVEILFFLQDRIYE